MSSVIETKPALMTRAPVQAAPLGLLPFQAHLASRSKCPMVHSPSSQYVGIHVPQRQTAMVVCFVKSLVPVEKSN